MKSIYSFFVLSIFLIFIACEKETTADEVSSNTNTLFTELSPSKTGVDFQNELVYDKDFNIYTYRNFYNGGGVALGDVNNDGLIDMYFTANMKPNRLYLNSGDFKFEDISEKADIQGTRAWSTGVAMVDINADGWMDIYVCNSGDIQGDNKQNELYINNGDLTFTEKAEEYGIADQGLSTHGVFFDYDKDGDLDLYLLNNSYRPIGSFNLQRNERLERDPIGGDKLYRNDYDGDKISFTDVSEEAGIYGSVIGFGLGVTVGDIDRDGWQDLYISNDFFERDYIYMNNGDGTFREELESQMRSISAASMGADMADITNDGYPEIFVTEMLPEKDRDIKQKTTFENWDRYQYNLRHDYYHQFTRNMLHLNNADGTFSEIGRLTGVEATDWSWGALICDLDNDGWKDIFVANGIYQDLTDQDYINFIADEETKKAIITRDGVDFKTLIDSIPVRPVTNYAFKNFGNLHFENEAKAWGLDKTGHSNGSVYGDLDNDGDLDLVLNNVNMVASIYKNNLSENNYLKLELEGEGQNIDALGARITIKADGKTFFQEHMPMRGFQSSMDYRPNFGLGNIDKIDSLIVEWLYDKVTIMTDVKVNQTLTLKQSEGQAANGKWAANKKTINKPLFKNLSASTIDNATHQENSFVDFDRDRLTFHFKSTQGPKIAVGDVNGDQREDFYLCGAKDSPGQLFLQKSNGQFQKANVAIFEENKIAEEVDALFFDADGDKDLDLYVACGGNEFPSSSNGLKDQLYFNDGKGNFTPTTQLLPAGKYETSSTVDAADFDSDGDMDLFVGIRLRFKLYGVPVNGYILENDGSGKFTNVTQQKAPDLLNIGMITDGIWTDFDGDNDADLMVVGDWMPVEVFQNNNGQFQRITETAGLAKSNGWWNKIVPADLDKDGDMDYLLGNHGQNSRFRATENEPLVMYVNDFDQNGTAEQFICRYEDGKLLPFIRKHDLDMQLPHLKKKYLRYSKYVGQTMEDIFPKEVLDKSVVKEAYTLNSSVAMNNGDGTFTLKALPIEAQFSPMFGILSDDFDQDGQVDVLMAGNFYGAKPEMGRYDADYGLLLKGDGKGGLVSVSAGESGFRIDGEVRDLVKLESGGKEVILVGRNDEGVLVFEWMREQGEQVKN